jgi:hypothetical protein
MWRALRNQSIKTQSLFFSSLGWSIYIILAIIYCQFYITYVVQDKPGLFGSLMWAMQDSSFWIICTPCVFVIFSRIWKKHKIHLASLFICSFLLALTYRIILATYSDNNTLIENLVVHTPVHFTISAFVFLCASLIFLPSEHQSQKQRILQSNKLALAMLSSPPNKLGNNCADENLAALQKSKILHVQTGTQDLDIAINEIESISAAGNYMEVSNGEKKYILRATMLALAKELQPYHFIRVHRSYLINRCAINEIRNNHIILKSGESFPFTKRYKNTIENQSIT